VSLIVKNLKINIGEKEVIKNASFEIKSGQITILEGPNGSGKSTLAWTLGGFPDYKVESGSVRINQQDLLKLKPNQIALSGLFLSFQNPVALPNITVAEFLRNAYRQLSGKLSSLEEFADSLEKWLHYLKLPISFLDRAMNEDFSGGEKKKLEVLQLLLFNPRYAILDEIDSGLDKESLASIAAVIKMLARNEKTGFLLITHYQKFIDLIKPQIFLTIKNGIIKNSNEPKN